MTIDEVYQAYVDTDREKYPNRILELINEIAHRRAHGEDPLGKYADLSSDGVDVNAIKKWENRADLTDMPLEFNGTAREYFRIWIVNLCLTILTLGIFSAWAKVRKKRYFYSHTHIDGTPFQYLARPIPILKGRLIAAAGFVLYYISNHFVTSIYPYILVAGLIAAPWVLIRSAAFNARYSAFRNMTFHLEAGYWDAAKKLYAFAIVPVFVVSLIVDHMGDKPYFLGAMSVIISIFFPFLICGIKKFIVEHTAYGGEKGVFKARGGQFFGIYFAAGLIVSVFAIPSGIIAMVLVSTDKVWLTAYLILIPIYFGYVVGYAYIRAKITNLVWNNTSLGPVRFKSTLGVMDLTKLYIANALGILASCGFLVPWAVIRTVKYRATQLKVTRGGELTEFVGSQKQSVAAVGAETLDLFDWDLSL